MEKERKIKEVTLNCNPKPTAVSEQSQEENSKKDDQIQPNNLAEKMPFTVKIY